MAITPNVEQMKRSPDLGGVGSPSVLQERRAEQNDGVTRESLEAGLHKQRLLLADCGPPVVGSRGKQSACVVACGCDVGFAPHLEL